MKTSVQKQKQRSGETHGGRTGLKTGRRILKRSTFTNGKRFEKAKARPKEMGVSGVARTVINGCASVSAAVHEGDKALLIAVVISGCVRGVFVEIRAKGGPYVGGRCNMHPKCHKQHEWYRCEPLFFVSPDLCHVVPEEQCERQERGDYGGSVRLPWCCSIVDTVDDKPHDVFDNEPREYLVRGPQEVSVLVNVSNCEYGKDVHDNVVPCETKDTRTLCLGVVHPPPRAFDFYFHECPQDSMHNNKKEVVHFSHTCNVFIVT